MRLHLVTLLALSPAVALAQPPGEVGQIATSGGDAQITTQSDVRLQVRPVEGTSGTRATLLGRRVGDRLGALHECYGRRLRDRPTLVGTVSMRLRLEARGALRIDQIETTANDRRLIRCFQAALRQTNVRELSRPVRVILEIVLQHSAAEGAASAEAQAAREQAVDIAADDEGRPTATGGTPDGQVQFRVTSDDGDDEERRNAITFLHNRMRSLLPGLRDCRRRAHRRTEDETGHFEVQVQVRRRGAPISRLRAHEVADDRAPNCIRRLFRRLDRAPQTEARGRLIVTIDFRPTAAPSPEP